jgi:hypothetical protein
MLFYVKKPNPIFTKMNTLHVDQLIGVGPLHFENLVVAGSIVEGVRPLGEVVHDVVRTQQWNPGRIVPRY